MRAKFSSSSSVVSQRKKGEKREKISKNFLFLVWRQRAATEREEEKESERLRGGVVEATKSLCVDPPGGFLFFFVVVETKKGLEEEVDFWQRLQIFEDAEEDALFTRGRWHTQKHRERKGNDNGNATEGIIEGMVENENVPLLLKPIIKNKNRAHTLTFFAILFLVAPAVALSRVGHPWLLLRVYKMHLKNMEILKEAALSWCSMPGCYSNPENFDEEIATNEKKEEGQLLRASCTCRKRAGRSWKVRWEARRENRRVQREKTVRNCSRMGQRSRAMARSTEENGKR